MDDDAAQDVAEQHEANDDDSQGSPATIPPSDVAEQHEGNDDDSPIAPVATVTKHRKRKYDGATREDRIRQAALAYYHKMVSQYGTDRTKWEKKGRRRITHVAPASSSCSSEAKYSAMSQQDKDEWGIILTRSAEGDALLEAKRARAEKMSRFVPITDEDERAIREKTWAAMNDDFKRVRETNAKLKLEIRNMRSEHDDQVRKLEDLKDQLTDFHTERIDLQERMKTAKREADDARDRWKELVREYAEYKRTRSRQDEEKTLTVDDEQYKVRFDQERRDLMQQLKESVAKATEMELTNKDLSDNNEILKTKAEQLTERETSIRERLQESEKMVLRLEAQLAQSTETEIVNKNLVDENQILKKKIERLTERGAQLREKLQENDNKLLEMEAMAQPDVDNDDAMNDDASQKSQDRRIRAPSPLPTLQEKDGRFRPVTLEEYTNRMTLCVSEWNALTEEKREKSTLHARKKYKRACKFMEADEATRRAMLEQAKSMYQRKNGHQRKNGMVR